MPDNYYNLNNPDFWGILLHFVINLLFLIVLIKFIYFRYTKKEKYMFGFFLIGIMIFFLGSLLKIVFFTTSMGFTLFAMFAILRFRTTSFTIKDMAYMLTIIGISLMNSLKLVGFPLLGIIIFDSIILISAFILEELIDKSQSGRQSIVYENLELLKPRNNKELIKDLSDKTGRKIVRFRIRRINYKKKVGMLDIYYKD